MDGTRPRQSALSTPRSLYRMVSLAEAVTWTLLIIGMILKYVTGLGSLPVLIGGSIHGFVFLCFAGTSVVVGVNQDWRLPRIIVAVAMAIVPYATVPFDARLMRTGALDGPWHTEHGGAARDDQWARALLRWFLRHPALLVVVFFAIIIVVMASLLLIGPPGGW